MATRIARFHCHYHNRPAIALQMPSCWIVQERDSTGRRRSTVVAINDPHLIVLGEIALAAQQKTADGSLAAKVCGY